MTRIRSIGVLTLLLVSCSASTVGAAPATSPTSAASPTGVMREPATLPVFPWESEVMDAFRASAVDIRLIGGSKFETFLGDRRDARVFIKTAGQGGAGADVLFLATPLREFRMCSAPSSPGFTKWTVVVDGKTVPGVEGSQMLYPLFGPRFVVLAWDAASVKALATVLGLSAPRC